MGTDISPDTIKSKVPKYILQDEELAILLKALDLFKAMKKADDYSINSKEDYKIASKMAKELRTKAGWEKYSKPDKEVLKIPPGLQQSCEVCDD